MSIPFKATKCCVMVVFLNSLFEGFVMLKAKSRAGLSFRLFWLAAVALLVSGTLVTVEAQQRSVGSVTGLPVPRFVTIQSDEVNVRTGPGIRYPVDWVYVRPSLPVEVIGEFDNWRKIRDEEGTEGWVHRSMLSGRRSVIVTGDVRPMRRSPDRGAPVVAHMEPGVLATLDVCREAWCEIEVSGLTGWVEAGHVWGSDPVTVQR